MGTREPPSRRPARDAGGLSHVLTGLRADLRSLRAEMAGERWGWIRIAGALALAVAAELLLAILL